LQATVADLTAQASGLEFGHGGQAGHVLAFDVLLGGLVNQRPQAFDFGGQFGQAKVDHLVVYQRFAEGLAFLAVLDGAVDAVLQALDHIGRAEQAFFLELQHLHHEARAFVADTVALGDAYVVEEHLGGLGAVHAEFFQGRADADAGGVHRQHDQRFVDVRLVVRGVGQQAHEVRAGRVGDPHFAAVDHVVIAVLACVGLEPGHVGAGAGFRDADATDLLAADGRAQEFVAQCIAAEAGEGGGAHVGLHADGHGNAAAANGAEFFGGDDRIAVVQAHAAELFGFGNAQQPEVAGLAQDRVDGKAPGFFPFVHVGVDLAIDEGADGAAQFLMFLGEDHCSCSPVRNAPHRSCWAAIAAPRRHGKYPAKSRATCGYPGDQSARHPTGLRCRTGRWIGCRASAR